MPAGKLVPMTAEEFNRRRRNRIARIVFPSVAAVLMVAVFTWRATKPAETQSYYAQGLEQFKSGKFYQAIAAFDRVIQERPDFRDAWRFRGMARAQVNQNTLARQDFERRDQCLGFGAAVGFDHADDDIGAAIEQFGAFAQHLERLADPGRGTEEDLQPAARFLLRGFEQRVRRRPGGFVHRCGIVAIRSNCRLRSSTLTCGSPITPSSG